MKRLLSLFVTCITIQLTFAQLSPLHVDGPYFRDTEGRVVILHGFAQTFSPWFNERGTKWNNYDVEGCLRYNKGIIDGIQKAGWKMTFVRQHMDPYWSNTPGIHTTGENDIHAFDYNRFTKYLDEVFVPMAEYAISKGLYVVMRPPGVCPENISIGDAYHQYLLKVWEHVAQHPKLKDNGAVMFELANEPIHINSGSRDKDEEMTAYMQAIVDVIRQHCNNILLIPGLGWQQQYTGFVKYPIKGNNIGYAVHCYPGWYNSGAENDVDVTYREFKRGWDSMITPIALQAPIVVTEMDWAPQKYQSSWGKAVTGKAGGEGFGANFIRIADETCNVSWLLFTDGNLLANYQDSAPDGNTFLTDPEACPRPCFRQYQYYATEEYRNIINAEGYGYQKEEEPLFSLTEQWFNPSIWEKGTFNEATGYLKTGQWGFGGWQYPMGADLSQWKYLVVELSRSQSCGASFRLFDVNNYWDKPAMFNFNNKTRLVIDLHQMKNETGRLLDPSHIYIAGFWTNGSSAIYIKDIYLSDDGSTPSAIAKTMTEDSSLPVYDLQGRKVGISDAMDLLPRGLYIVNGKKLLR